MAGGFPRRSCCWRRAIPCRKPMADRTAALWRSSRMKAGADAVDPAEEGIQPLGLDFHAGPVQLEQPSAAILVRRRNGNRLVVIPPKSVRYLLAVGLQPGRIHFLRPRLARGLLGPDRLAIQLRSHPRAGEGEKAVRPDRP